MKKKFLLQYTFCNGPTNVISQFVTANAVVQFFGLVYCTNEVKEMSVFYITDEIGVIRPCDVVRNGYLRDGDDAICCNIVDKETKEVYDYAYYPNH